MNNIILFWAFEGSYNENLFLYLIIQELSLILFKSTPLVWDIDWCDWIEELLIYQYHALSIHGWKFYFILFYHYKKLLYQLYGTILQYS